MEKSTSPVQDRAKYLKRRMMTSRITGIFASLIAIAGIVLMTLGIINDWLCTIIVVYALATILSSNSFLQGMKMGNAWQRLNTFLSILFYLATVVLIILGFCIGELSTLF